MADRIRYNQDPDKLHDELNQINTVTANLDNVEIEDENESALIFRNSVPNDSEEEDAILSTLNI